MRERNRVFIIAEAGVNHNGDLALAKELVDCAVAAKVDAIKFQTFKANLVVVEKAPMAAYQKENLGSETSQLAMIRPLELSDADHRAVCDYCRQKGLTYLSTPFDLPSVDLLASMGVVFFKIPSGEITNKPYLRKIGSLGKDILLSTGMADLGDIEDAITVLETAGTPRDRITLLHCHTEYPTAWGDVNLRAMAAMGAAFGLPVGYSDHTLGLEMPIAAAALGARVIEKHFTLDKTMRGPDHCMSLDPGELAAMVRAIRHVESAMGDGVKRPTARELKNRKVVRKSLVALKPIAKGEPLTAENVTVKRPGTGISPMLWDEVIGKAATKDYLPDDLI